MSKNLMLLISLLSLWPSAMVRGQIADAPAPERVSGIVVSSANNTSFILVDKSGVEIPLSVNASTSYVAGKADAHFEDVVKPGMNVRCYFASPGVAGQLIARGFADQLSGNQIRAFMHCTDEEWTIFSSRIENIRTLRRLAEGRGNYNGNGNNNGDDAQSSASDSSVRVLLKSLQTAYWTSGPSGNEYKANLDSLRDLRAKARSDLARARKELTELVTPKQELLLVLQGILE